MAEKSRANADPFRATQAAFAAKRHLVDGLTLKEVAAELGISRFKAARLVEWARGNGIVRIEIAGGADTDFLLGAALEREYGLKRALVVAGLDGPSDSVRAGIGKVAAAGLAELVRPNDVVGISWGRALDAVVDQLPPLRARQVVQLVGGMATAESAASGVDLVRRFALGTGAEGLALIAPLIVATAAGAESLRDEPMIAKTLRTIESVTVAIAGVGSWDPPSSRLVASFDPAEAESLLGRGVVADICGIMVGADGALLSPDSIDARRIGVLPAQLQRMPTVVAIAGGREKHHAITAVLRSKMVNVLITDAGAAHAALAAALPAGDAS
jgi:DNA-binding transcriptional regulator LsrR (DeoR family)